ncbi:hypothetical protein HPB47_021862, partial [Ixodes persulcatus]
MRASQRRSTSYPSYSPRWLRLGSGGGVSGVAGDKPSAAVEADCGACVRRSTSYPSYSPRWLRLGSGGGVSGVAGDKPSAAVEADCGACVAHFEEDQYEPRRTDRKLKAFAVPTLFEHRRPPRRRRQLRRSTPPPAPVKEPDPKKDARLTAASIAASNDHTYLAPRDQPPSTVRNQGPPKPQPPSVTVTFAMPNSLSSSPMIFTASATSPFCSLVPATSVCTGGVGSAPAGATSPMLLLQTGGTTSSALPGTTSGAPTSVPNSVVIRGVPAPAT